VVLPIPQVIGRTSSRIWLELTRITVQVLSTNPAFVVLSKVVSGAFPFSEFAFYPYQLHSLVRSAALLSSPE
jgi:hypothetical protein